jgi:hypothetical protein
MFIETTSTQRQEQSVTFVEGAIAGQMKRSIQHCFEVLLCSFLRAPLSGHDRKTNQAVAIPPAAGRSALPRERPDQGSVECKWINTNDTLTGVEKMCQMRGKPLNEGA